MPFSAVFMLKTRLLGAWPDCLTCDCCWACETVAFATQSCTTVQHQVNVTVEHQYEHAVEWSANTVFSCVQTATSTLSFELVLWHTGSVQWWWVRGLPAQQQQYTWQNEGSLWTCTSGGLSLRQTRHALGICSRSWIGTSKPVFASFGAGLKSKAACTPALARSTMLLRLLLYMLVHRCMRITALLLPRLSARPDHTPCSPLSWRYRWTSGAATSSR